MKKLTLYMAIFIASISLPLGYVIWQSFTGLEQEERAQLQYFSETLFDQMEKELTSIVVAEENRTIDEYQYFLAPSAEAGYRRQQLSPLAETPYPDYILGYLQINADGSFQTPLAPDISSIPENKKKIYQQLSTASQIFNKKKFNLPQPRQEPVLQLQLQEQQLKEVSQSAPKQTLADRYLSRSRDTAAQTYLGKKQQRVEEISAEQKMNIVSDDAPMPRSVSDIREERRKVIGKDKESSLVGMVGKFDIADDEILEKNEIVEKAEEFGDVGEVRQKKFQVEVAPFQSIAINDDQVYIFRWIALENHIYRQGFILLVQPFLKHLAKSHFAGQPLATFTSLQLQRNDLPQSQMVTAGVAMDNTIYLAHRVFPAPFNFITVSLSTASIPPSPARSSLNTALAVLATVMLLGLLAIYQSARIIVNMSERRSEFVSSVTHELKTPLTNIRMYIEMLEQGIAPTPEREQHYLAVLSSESARLSGLINNVLELAKLEKKQRHFQMQEGQLVDVFYEVSSIMAEKLKQEGFTLNISAAEIPIFRFDKEVLIQILINLIDNSIKFGKKSTLRRIAISAASTSECVRIEVSDSGPGIPRLALRKVFDDFYRVDNHLTRTTGGTGIGLALVKKFMEAMGGRVSAANNDGPGCTITLLLPR
jgi:signal transduction histidine kinase